MALRLRINDETFEESSDEDDSDTDENEDVDVKTEATEDSRYPRKIYDITWFHNDISRNTAEALLLQNGNEGTYLLRSSTRTKGEFTVSVKGQDSVKHYTLKYNPFTKSYFFGNGEFQSLRELIDHFECQPVLISESGLHLVLKYPYNKNIGEPPSYEKIFQHTEGGSKIAGDSKEPHDFQIGSKEGHLVKRGKLHKNWKKRWFVLHKNYLKYFKDRESHTPIRVIDLRLASSASRDAMDGKENCFNLCLPKRTFYFHTVGPDEAEQWLKVLQWKIGYYGKAEDKMATI